MLNLNYSELLSEYMDFFISVSKQQSDYVEAITRERTNKCLWYRFRSGRVTVSRMKSV